MDDVKMDSISGDVTGNLNPGNLDQMKRQCSEKDKDKCVGFT